MNSSEQKVKGTSKSHEGHVKVMSRPRQGYDSARHKQNFTVANSATNYQFTVAKPVFTVATNIFV